MNIKDEDWQEFLRWGKREKFNADGFMEIWAANSLTKPTEENFWRWYQEFKITDVREG